MDYLYAGFWKRAWAQFADEIIVVPLVLFYFFYPLITKPIAVGLILIFTLLTTVYTLTFHALYGQTLGKMLMNIKVLRTDGGKIGWKETLKRYSVEFVLKFLETFALCVAIWAVSDALFYASVQGGIFSDASRALDKTLESLSPLPFWFEYITSLWGFASVACLVFHRQKRTLHDFLGGTMVVVVTKDETTQEKIPLMIPKTEAPALT